MNVRFGQKLVLLAVVCVAGPATASATDRGGPALGVPGNSTTATAADKGGATEVLISDSESQSTSDLAAITKPNNVPSSTSTFGWRSRRAAATSAAHSSDPCVSASLSTANKPAPIAAASQVQDSSSSNSFGLKLTEAAALAARIHAENGAATTTAATTPAAEKATPQASGASIEPQALHDDAIRLATTKIADAKVQTADSEEPIPTPVAPYADDGSVHMGAGESCECFNDECCPQRRPLFWTSGVEATFLRPDLNDGAAQFGVTEYAKGRFDEFSTFTDDVNDIYVSPRIWVGVQGCLWGVNARYWHLRANEGSFDPTLGSDSEWDGPQCGIPDFGYTSCNNLEAYTIDLEITRRLCVYDCWMQFSAGVRHAEIEHDAALNAQALADDSILFSYAGAHRASRGTGIVLGWYGRKPIFPCSCVHWFYNFHWSALWGPTETAAETGVLVALTSTDPDAVAAAGSVNGASTHVSDNLFVGEIQLGLEWDYALRCLPANAFCRAAVEYQRWSGGTGYSAANSFAGVEIDSVPTTLGDALAIADSPELDLIGLSVATGLTW